MNEFHEHRRRSAAASFCRFASRSSPVSDRDVIEKIIGKRRKQVEKAEARRPQSEERRAHEVKARQRAQALRRHDHRLMAPAAIAPRHRLSLSVAVHFNSPSGADLGTVKSEPQSLPVIPGESFDHCFTVFGRRYPLKINVPENPVDEFTHEVDLKVGPTTVSEATVRRDDEGNLTVDGAGPLPGARPP